MSSLIRTGVRCAVGVVILQLDVHILQRLSFVGHALSLLHIGSRIGLPVKVDVMDDLHSLIM